MPASRPILEEQWVEICRLLIEELGEETYLSWIQPLKPIDIQGASILFSVPSLFMKNWISTHYSSAILKHWNAVVPHLKKIDFSIQVESATAIKEGGGEQQVSDLGNVEEKDLCEVSSLDSRFTFDNFVVGKPNELAYAAAYRTAESDIPSFNPLFLYGGVGLGKTHLMHSIAWLIKNRAPHKRIIYVSAEKFMHQFIRSVRYKNTDSFKDLFRSVDVLMIDDVQFIGGKDTTQEEFFHTFNALVDNNRQVIVSADKSPSDLEKVEERLKSRLGWGLVADIHPTTYELRLGILQAKAAKLSVRIPDEVLEFLALKISSNVRELEGALNRVAAHATLIGRAVDLDAAQNLLKDLLRSSERHITIEEVQRRVCEYYSIKMLDLLSSKRIKNLARSRQVAIYLSKNLTTKSLADIGKKFGGRDHTTVLHAVRKIQELIEEDKEIENDVGVLRRALDGSRM